MDVSKIVAGSDKIRVIDKESYWKDWLHRKIWLWVDDERFPPTAVINGNPKEIVWAKSGEDALEILKSNSVEIASLDHDLGWCENCCIDAQIEDGIIMNPKSLQCTHRIGGTKLSKKLFD